jgi:hypothetical protein
MPSKLRLVLEMPNKQRLCGAQAVDMLCDAAKENFMSMKLPLDWNAMNKQRRLEFLATLLPKGCKLTLFREPKWTRNTRSAYRQALAQGAVLHQKQKAPELPNAADRDERARIR